MFNKFGFYINFCEKIPNLKLTRCEHKLDFNELRCQKQPGKNTNTPEASFDKLEIYFKNLPQFLKKCEKESELSSYIWLQKTGKKNLQITEKNNMICKKKKKNYFRLIFLNIVTKENQAFFYKKKFDFCQSNLMEKKFPDNEKKLKKSGDIFLNTSVDNMKKAPVFSEFRTLFTTKFKKTESALWILVCYLIIKFQEKL